SGRWNLCAPCLFSVAFRDCVIAKDGQGVWCGEFRAFAATDRERWRPEISSVSSSLFACFSADVYAWFSSWQRRESVFPARVSRYAGNDRMEALMGNEEG
ncbi:unnamed protein product, partial [Ectocarpus sp. 13 AM-2016]